MISLTAVEYVNVKALMCPGKLAVFVPGPLPTGPSFHLQTHTLTHTHAHNSSYLKPYRGLHIHAITPGDRKAEKVFSFN